MKRFTSLVSVKLLVGCAALAMALVACDDGGDPQNPGPVVEPPPVVTGKVIPAIASSAANKWSLPTTAPARNASCDAPDGGVYGAFVEWTGFDLDGTTYTCNGCPGGKELWHGTWRAVFDGDQSDPDEKYPGDPSYKERWTINGNTFVMDIYNDAEGEARMEGFFWCGQKPEVDNETTMVVFTKVEPEGAFGWTTGSVHSMVVLTQGINLMLSQWYDGVKTSGSGGFYFSAPYCRVGKDVAGTNSDGTTWTKPCLDPFSP